MSVKMGIDTKCFVCNNTIKNLDNDSTKIKKLHECKRFYALVCRYLNLDCDPVELPNIKNYNTTKTLRPDENITYEKTPVSCCDSCIPLIKSFSDTYNNWKILQLALNCKLETITKLMLIKSEFKNDTDPHLPGEIFRSPFLRSVNDKSRCFPRLALSKVKVPPPRPKVKPELIQSDSYSGSPEGSHFGADDSHDMLLDDNQYEEQEYDLEEKAVAKPKQITRRKCGRKSRKRPTKSKIHKCRFCQKTFTHGSNCKDHEYSHSGVKPYKCNLCGNCFSHKANLHRHKRSHHKNTAAEYKCQFCDKYFKYKCNLAEHERVHSGQKPYSCGVCSKKFAAQSNCKRHEANHTLGKSKPFSCHYCDKKFRARANVKIHERCHTGEKPYSCQYCNKTFGRQDYLLKHERIHTGEKPYSCQYCDKNFAHKLARRRHEQSHKPSKPGNVVGSGKKEFKLKTERNDETLQTEPTTNNNYEAIKVRIIKSEYETM